MGTKKEIEDQVTDMAILMDWAENSSPIIDHEPFFRNSFYAFIPEGHPLYHHDSVTVHELSDLPMVYLSGPEISVPPPIFKSYLKNITLSIIPASLHRVPKISF